MKLLWMGILAATLGLVAFELPLRRAASSSAERSVPDGGAAAQRALAAASAQKRALVGSTGVQRQALRERAVEAFRAVRREHSHVPAVAAEAAFRAGELLRAAGRAGEARVEFEQAQRLGAGTPFLARGGLELGHLARREKRPADALREYERVRGDAGAELEHRHQAAWWAGRVEAAEGRFVDAARLFELVSRDAEDPLDRIRGYESWAGVLIEAGDLEAAAEVLESCRLALLDRALEETRFGQQVRAALEGMRAGDLLERAVLERAVLREEGTPGRAETVAPLPLERGQEPFHDRLPPSDARLRHPSDPTPLLRRVGTSSPPLFPPTGF